MKPALFSVLCEIKEKTVLRDASAYKIKKIYWDGLNGGPQVP